MLKQQIDENSSLKNDLEKRELTIRDLQVSLKSVKHSIFFNIRLFLNQAFLA